MTGELFCKQNYDRVATYQVESYNDYAEIILWNYTANLKEIIKRIISNAGGTKWLRPGKYRF